MAIAASCEAIKDSGLDITTNAHRYGCSIGVGIGALKRISETSNLLMDNGPKRVSPFFIPSMISDMASGQVSIRYGFKGPNYCVVSACATATHSIGDAFIMIQYGDADIIFSGGTEASVHPLAVAGFTNMKALSKNKDYSKED